MAAKQLDEGVERRERGRGVRECSDEGVVHEGVGVGEVLEETESVVESVGDGDGAVEKELAQHDGVSVEAGNVDTAVDLLRGSEAAALAQQ